MLASCPVCGTGERTDVLSLPQLPVLINAQVEPEDATSVRRGDIDLVVCHGCGHLYNRSFDQSLLAYDAAYENTLHFSPSFQTFAAGLADRMLADHDLRGATIAELGSGPGHFMSMLCDRGVARGYGFDPSYDPDRLGAPEHPAVAISTERFPDDGSIAVSLAFSQHVLEHLVAPVDALRAQRKALAVTDGVVYTEVPNGQLMIDRCALWDLIYEHVSYFVPGSLVEACARAELDPVRVDTAFGDQFLWCEAVPGTNAAVDRSGDLAAVVARAVAFGELARRRIADASVELTELVSEGPVVLWGAGSKGVTYLNVVEGAERVAHVIDINPRKAGHGVPGTHAVVSGPERLVGEDPCTVLAANPIYVPEIERQLAELGVAARVRPLWS